MGSPSARVIFRRPVARRGLVAGVHGGLELLERGDRVGQGRADELISAGLPQAELDLLAVDQDELAVVGQGAVGDDQVEAGGFPGAGFAAEQHVAFGQVDVDRLAVFVLAQVDRVEHRERKGRDRRHLPGLRNGGHEEASFRGGSGIGWRAVPSRAGDRRAGQAAGPCSSGGCGTRARTGRCEVGAFSRARGDVMVWLAARVSRRMTSMVTSWDQRRLRVTRASRA